MTNEATIAQGRSMVLDIPDAGALDAFARFSGDASPLHLDANFARRTRFRRRLVPGVLLLLRALCKATPDSVRIARVQARFVRPVALGDDPFTVTLTPSGQGIDLEAKTEGITLFSAQVAWQEMARKVDGAGDPACAAGPAEPLAESSDPLSFEGTQGELRRSADGAALAAALGGEIGGLQTQDALALALVSTVVGMRAPGRFGSLLGFEVELVSAAGKEAALAYRVERVSGATRILRIRLDPLEGVTGPSGNVTAMVLQPHRPPVIDNAIGGSNRLDGHRSLIVGASGGLGGAIAHLFAREGARLVLSYRAGGPAAAQLADRVRNNGGEAIALELDLARTESCESAVADAIEALGGLDSVIHCAVPDANANSFKSTTEREFREQLDVAVLGTRRLVHAALPHLLETRGAVVALSSTIVDTPVANFSAYTTAKAALDGLIRALAAEYEPQGVRFRLVSFGFVLTDLHAAATSSEVERLSRQNPAGAPLDAATVAEAVCHAVTEPGEASDPRYVVTP